MFDYMSYSQIAALFLGIAFTVISIATTFLAVKYANKFKSFIKVIFCTLLAPFVASVGWLFLILSFIKGLRNDELLNLVISIILALFICAMVVTVAKALHNKHADEFEKDEEDEEIAESEDENAADQEIVDGSELIEEGGEPARIEDKKAPLLLAHTPKNENVVDEDVEVEESEEEPLEVEDETPVEDEVEDETVEETAEENNDEPAEEVETSEEEPQEGEPAEEAETTEDEDEDLTEDEEFEKFLEELKKKVEENPDGEGENK